MNRLTMEYLTRLWEDIKGYCPHSEDHYRQRIIPKEYYTSRTKSLAVFKSDNRKASGALDRAIKTMIECGKLIDVSKTKKLYQITPDFIK